MSVKSAKQSKLEKLENKLNSQAGSKLSLMIALIVGFIGIICISLFTHWYEVIVTHSYYATSVALTIPPLVFFLYTIVLVINGLIKKFIPALIMKRRELLTILALWLMTSAVCYLGVVQPVALLVGTANNKDIAKPMTKSVDFQQYLNKDLFLNAQDSNNFYYGISDGLSRVSFTAIPWGKWLGPGLFWVPFILIAIVLSVSLVKTLHRQWSKHELLTYPLADFSGTLMTYEKKRALPDIFYDPMFLWGAGVVVAIYLINGLHSWFPLMIEIPLAYHHTDIMKSFPYIQKYCGREGYSLFRGMLYPIIVAIAFLLPTELSFSCWAGWVLMVLGTGFYFLTTGDVIGSTETGFITAGMFVAMLGAIIFIGRKEYWNILKNSFVMKKTPDSILNSAITACRIFMISFVFMVIALIYAGLDLYTAILFVAAFSLVAVLLARFTAETGIPWLVSFSGKAIFFPLTILGPAALGPKSIAVLTTVAAVFAVGMGTANSIASQETTYEKVAEKTYTPTFKKGMYLILFAGLILALFTSFFGTLSDNYSFGASVSRNSWPGTMNYNSKKINRLNIEGVSEKVENLGKFNMSRLSLAQAEPDFWKFFFIGVTIILVCMFMRLRFTWWMFHPLPFLLLNSWCLSRLYISFLVGWAIKVAILKVGGGKVFTRTKPFFMGIIIGQCVISGIWILVNVIYFLVTDTQPPRMHIFP